MFKRILAAGLLLAGLQAEARTFDTPVVDLAQLQESIMGEVGTLGLPWKVGETADYNLDMGFIQGTMKMSVREETSQGFWLDQDADLGFMGQQKIEIHIDKNNGQILELIVNGQKQNPPAPGNTEIEETRQDNITVPAGSFECIYARIKDLDKGEVTEAWINTSIVPIAGMLKQIAPGPMGNVTMELTGFNKL
jgi:hypothetical protein